MLLDLPAGFISKVSSGHMMSLFLTGVPFNAPSPPLLHPKLIMRNMTVPPQIQEKRKRKVGWIEASRVCLEGHTHTHPHKLTS